MPSDRVISPCHTSAGTSRPSKSASIVQQGLQILINLEHRGACGSEPNTGDGAGILLQIPHKFFKKATKSAKIKLPEAGRYGVAMIYLPKEEKARQACERMFERIVREEGQHILGWRAVPTPAWSRA